MAVYGIPGLSMAVLKNRQIDWAEGFGIREIGKSDPVTADTMFQCLSVAKIVAAMGMLRLAQEGSYVLDDDGAEGRKVHDVGVLDAVAEAPARGDERILERQRADANVELY